MGNNASDQVQRQDHQRASARPIVGDAGVKHIPVDSRHDATPRGDDFAASTKKRKEWRDERQVSSWVGRGKVEEESAGPAVPEKVL